MTKEKCFKCKELFDKEDLEQIETVSSGTVNLCVDCSDEIIECENCNKDDFKDKCYKTEEYENLCEECYKEYKNEVTVIDAISQDSVDYREFTGKESGFWTEETASIYGEQCPKCKVFYISGEHDCKGWNSTSVDSCPNCGELFVDPIIVVDENGDEIEYEDEYMNTGVWTKEKLEEGMVHCPECDIWIQPGYTEIKNCPRCKSNKLEKYDSDEE